MEELTHRCRESNTNKARDITRMALRYKKWPKVYEAKVRGRTVANGSQEVPCRIATLLPHEFVYVLKEQNDLSSVLNAQETLRKNRPDFAHHLVDDRLWCGLWQDGVPFNSNRERSLDTFIKCYSIVLATVQNDVLPLSPNDDPNPEAKQFSEKCKNRKWILNAAPEVDLERKHAEKFQRTKIYKRQLKSWSDSSTS